MRRGVPENCGPTLHLNYSGMRCHAAADEKGNTLFLAMIRRERSFSLVFGSFGLQDAFIDPSFRH